MTELLTAAQMRAIEQAAIESGEVTGLELMERAGRGVVEAILEEWPEYAKAPRRAVVLCGPGNNGGDGFVVARLLKEQHWDVAVLLYGDAEKLPPDAKANYERWSALGPTGNLTYEEFHQARSGDVFVDAIFGTGLTRPVAGDLKDLLSKIAGGSGDYKRYHPRLVAVDLPSGLCSDSGRVLGGPPDDDPFSSPCPFARLTVTFDSPKIGHYLGRGPAHCGRLVIKDIGLKVWRMLDVPKDAGRLPGRRGYGFPYRPGRTWLLARDRTVQDGRFDLRPKPVLRWLGKAGWGTHKYDHGHALVVSGGVGKGGAARLAARGALRIGAGLVTVGAPPPAMSEHAAHLNAIMLAPIADSYALSGLLRDKRYKALCLGPGLGTGEGARDLVRAALQAKRATVLDADALTAFEGATETLFRQLHKDCVLTPHEGEFARLFPDIAKRMKGPEEPVWTPPPNLSEGPGMDLAYWEELARQGDAYREALANETGPAFSKVDAVREAAERTGCVVLLKGPATVIGWGEIGAVAVHSAQYDRAAPWLATAGSGDVLAGFITGLMARGYDAMGAAEAAVWLHVECARSFGPGLIAEDLPEELPKVFRSLDL
ncbi:MAG: NAD(P)H-hydrate epimerase [Pseudomonadota bacterium]